MFEILGIALAVYTGIGVLLATLCVSSKSGRDTLQASVPIELNPAIYALIFLILTITWITAIRGVKLNAEISKEDK